MFSQLISYALSTVEVCDWVKQFWAGVLPLGKLPKRLSATHHQALEAGRWYAH